MIRIFCYAVMTMYSSQLPHSYSRLRIALHWLSALVIIWATCSGFFAASCAADNPARKTIDTINPQLTTLFIPFFAMRLALYLKSKPWREWTAQGTTINAPALGHGLLYVFITLVLATGLLIMPHRWLLLGVLPMPAFVQNPNQLMWLSKVHGVLCMLLGGLVSGHIGAVLWHHIVGRPVLNRMKFRHATQATAME